MDDKTKNTRHNPQRLLFKLACLATLIALFYAEENWRGWHAWSRFKKESEAKGEKFDRQSVIPPPVPDDQNFALTPLVFTSYGQMLTRDGKMIPVKDRATNFVNRMQMHIAGDDSPLDWRTNGTGNWQKAEVADLTAWQNYYHTLAIKMNLFPIAPQPQTPAQDVLLALSKYDSTIEELRAAGRLPYSRFPLEYDKDRPFDILLPHLACLKSGGQVLQLRSLAELQTGQSERALADVKLLLRLTDSIRTEPFLISHLVRIAMANLALQPVYEGLAEHKWSDAQLTGLDAELARLNFVADYQFAMRGEMALCDDGAFDYLRHHPEELLKLSETGEGVPAARHRRPVDSRRLVLPKPASVHAIDGTAIYPRGGFEPGNHFTGKNQKGGRGFESRHQTHDALQRDGKNLDARAGRRRKKIRFRPKFGGPGAHRHRAGALPARAWRTARIA